MIDLAAALRRLAGDRELVQLMIRLFQDDAPVLLEAIKIGMRNAQWPETHRAAHSLKGLAANLDAKPVMDSAWEIERMTREGTPDFSVVREAFTKLEQDVSATIDVLKIIPPG